MAYRPTASLLLPLAFALPGFAAAQNVWVAKDLLGQVPSSRHRLAMAYDSVRQETLLYGGWVSAAPQRGTFVFDGLAWSARTPATNPGDRFEHAMAFDRARGVTVLFGGQSSDSGPVLSDTWEWDGTTWRAVTSATVPPARAGHTLAFDSVRQRVIMFGGYTSGGPYLDDTWAWDGTTWTDLRPVTHPGTLAGHGMCTDPAGNRVLLFGGYSSALDSTGTNQLWAWDGTTWSQLAPAASPPPRGRARLAATPGQPLVVMAGGWSNRPMNDSWLFDGTSWNQGRNLPQAVYGHDLVSDERRRTVVSAGSQGAFATFAFTPFPALTTAYGAACGSPAPALQASARPYLGNASFALTLTSAAPLAPAALLLSGRTGNSAVGPCTVLIDPAQLLVAIAASTNAAGSLTLPLPIAATWRNAGVNVHAQGALAAPGLATTAGLTVQLGH